MRRLPLLAAVVLFLAASPALAKGTELGDPERSRCRGSNRPIRPKRAYEHLWRREATRTAPSHRSLA